MRKDKNISSKAIFLIALALFFPKLGLALDVTLEWNSNVEENLAGYVVYFGTESRYEALYYDNEIDVGDWNSHTIYNLEDGITYYFAVRAYNDQNYLSGYSTEICFPECPIPTGDDDNNNSVDSASGGGGGGCFITSVGHPKNFVFFVFCVIILAVAAIVGYKARKRGSLKARRLESLL
jgi:hypothetical protein